MRKIPLRELAVFCRKAAFLFDAGISVADALPVLATQTSGRIPNAILFDVHKMILQGESFSYALRVSGVFPAFMCGFVAIGERTARIPETFAKLADFYEASARTNEELAAAMLYPALVATVMFGVLIAAVTFVLPGYSRIFEASGIALPGITSSLLSMSNFFSENILFVLIGVLIFLLCAMFFFKSTTGHLFASRVKLKIPIWRQKTNLNITEGFSILLSSGLGIPEAVSVCGEIFDNPIVVGDLQNVSLKLDSGLTFRQSLSEIPYIDPLLTELVGVGEETGRLPQTIEKCNVYFESAYRHEVRRLNKLIEPVLTITLGTILGAIMLAIILPTFELATAL
ncbi:MAG: type II secretion system F family protein [Defluviitaleaceae bacterium]|nr:type II secretion system F family protein [Defluviitaleaceae bacterium]